MIVKKAYRKAIVVCLVIAVALTVCFMLAGKGLSSTSEYNEENEKIELSKIILPDTELTKHNEKASTNKPQESTKVKTGETEQGETTLNAMDEVDVCGETESVVPEDKTSENKELSCTFSIRCDTIFLNKDKLKPQKEVCVPENGIIFMEKSVSFSKGESVFDVLKRETKNANIHMEFVKSPAYNTAYIKGINNIYEFDCGELSGWVYKVNGESPGVGCSAYILKDGDKVEWLYTCNMGRDIK